MTISIVPNGVVIYSRLNDIEFGLEVCIYERLFHDGYSIVIQPFTPLNNFQPLMCTSWVEIK